MAYIMHFDCQIVFQVLSLIHSSVQIHFGSPTHKFSSFEVTENPDFKQWYDPYKDENMENLRNWSSTREQQSKRMKEDQYRTLMEMMKSPLKYRIGGRMKEETMRRLQSRQGRKVKEEGKDKMEFSEPR
jgi:hypothetical protein